MEMFRYNLRSINQAIEFLSADHNHDFGFAVYVLQRKRDELQAYMAAPNLEIEKELEEEVEPKMQVRAGKEKIWLPNLVDAYNRARNALPKNQRVPKYILDVMKRNDPCLKLKINQVQNYVHNLHKKVRQLLGLNLSSVQIPDATHRIYKHEC